MISSNKIHQLRIEECPKPEPDILAKRYACNECERHLNPPQIGAHCFNFSLAPKRNIYKTSLKHLKIHKFPFKNVIVLAIECKMYLKIQQKLHCLGCISKQTMRSVVKKTRLNSSKDDFLMKSFPSSTKRKLSIVLTFSFHFLSFKGVFLKGLVHDNAHV